MKIRIYSLKGKLQLDVKRFICLSTLVTDKDQLLKCHLE